MLFELNIKDPKGKLLLKDVFFMDSITNLMDVSTALLESFEDPQDRNGYALSIRSHKATHVGQKLKNIDQAMKFKNALYDYLIDLHKKELYQVS